MNRLFSYILLALVLVSCGAPSGRFRLEGHFKNLNQGEFYIYDIDNGRKDTIAVRDGRFVYDIALTDTATLSLLFPNYSELPVFAHPGAKVKMDGDVSHLRETQITGTRDNKDMTNFRLETNGMAPAEMQQAARRYIEAHPASVVSQYLLRRYFILSAEPDYVEAARLCALMRKAQPQSVPLVRLHQHLQALKNMRREGRLPAFKAVSTAGDTVTNSQLNRKANVIYAWAAWNYDSQAALRLLHRVQLEHPADVAVLLVSLDAAPSEGRRFLEGDSITWPNVCDSLLWQSPLLARLGIATVPANIITDAEGRIVGRNLPNAEFKKTLDSLVAVVPAK